MFSPDFNSQPYTTNYNLAFQLNEAKVRVEAKTKQPGEGMPDSNESYLALSVVSDDTAQAGRLLEQILNEVPLKSSP
jgi:hypothetical protein